jgi:ubiquinol oxidase
MSNFPDINLGVHHKVVDVSDGIAFGFTKAPRFCADTLFARRYWKLPGDATRRDVVFVVRADEALHRDVNHGFASELAGSAASPMQISRDPEHAAQLEPAG